MKSPTAVAITLFLLISCMLSMVVGKDALLVDQKEEPFTTTRSLVTPGSNGTPIRFKPTKRPTRAVPTPRLESEEVARALKGKGGKGKIKSEEESEEVARALKGKGGKGKIKNN